MTHFVVPEAKTHYFPLAPYRPKWEGMLKSNNLYFASDSPLDRCVSSISQSLVAIRLKAASFQWKAGERVVSFLPTRATAIFRTVPQSVGDMGGFSEVTQPGGSGEFSSERRREEKGEQKEEEESIEVAMAENEKLS